MVRTGVCRKVCQEASRMAYTEMCRKVCQEASTMSRSEVRTKMRNQLAVVSAIWEYETLLTRQIVYVAVLKDNVERFVKINC